MANDGIRPGGHKGLVLLDRQLPCEVLAQRTITGEPNEAADVHHRASSEPNWGDADVTDPRWM